MRKLSLRARRLRRWNHGEMDSKQTGVERREAEQCVAVLPVREERMSPREGTSSGQETE